MGQIIEWCENCNNGERNMYALYRGGVNEWDEKCWNGYKIHHVDGADKYNRKSYNSKDVAIVNKFMFYIHNDNERVINFFGFDKNNPEVQRKEVDLSICFSNVCGLVLFKNNAKKPKRIEKLCKTRNKTYKEWCYNVWLNEIPLNLKYWKFASVNDYIVCDWFRTRDLLNLIPEVTIDVLNEETLHKVFYYSTDLKFRNEYLYNMEPINLNQSWDYSEEKKKYYLDLKEKQRLAQMKAELEREERKNTPGYCDQCGAANADYVADPYYYEMYGETYMKWLCDSCYYDSAMSV